MLPIDLRELATLACCGADFQHGAISAAHRRASTMAAAPSRPFTATVILGTSDRYLLPPPPSLRYFHDKRLLLMT